LKSAAASERSKVELDVVMSVDAGAGSRGVRPRSFLGRIRENLTDGPGFAWLMMTPPLLLLALVVGVPLAKAVQLSFDRVVLTRPALAGDFTLHNYEKLFTDPEAWAAVWRSCLYMSGTVIGSVVLGLGAALLTRRIVRFRGLARSIFILPWSMPALVAALVWGVMYDSNFGVINRILTSLPFVTGNVEWLLNRHTVLPALIVVQVWNEFPVAYIFFLAGLHAIPEELYEAASVDGASRIRQFWHITLPQIRYVMAVIVVLLLIFGFRSFPVVFLLTGGRVETLTVATFNAAFRSYDFSYAATLGILAVFVSLILVLVYLRVALRGGKAEAAS
jgi:multiple sugar transport system permease protein